MSYNLSPIPNFKVFYMRQGDLIALDHANAGFRLMSKIVHDVHAAHA